MNPASGVVKRCYHCGELFELTDDQILWFLNTFGEDGVPKRCRQCRDERRMTAPLRRTASAPRNTTAR